MFVVDGQVGLVAGEGVDHGCSCFIIDDECAFCTIDCSPRDDHYAVGYVIAGDVGSGKSEKLMVGGIGKGISFHWFILSWWKREID